MLIRNVLTPCLNRYLFDTLKNLWISAYEIAPTRHCYERIGFEITRDLFPELANPTLTAGISPPKRTLECTRGDGLQTTKNFPSKIGVGEDSFRSGFRSSRTCSFSATRILATTPLPILTDHGRRNQLSC
jgi:hypothetical protein